MSTRIVADRSIPSASPVVWSQSLSAASTRFTRPTPDCAPVAALLNGLNLRSNVTLPAFAACPGAGVPLTLSISPVTSPRQRWTRKAAMPG
jgi:hypothetical protein